MTKARELLEIAAEYVSYRQAAEASSELVSPAEADSKLDEIAHRFESALGEYRG